MYPSSGGAVRPWRSRAGSTRSTHCSTHCSHSSVRPLRSGIYPSSGGAVRPWRSRVGLSAAALELLHDLADASQPRFSELSAGTAVSEACADVGAPSLDSVLSVTLAGLAPARRREYAESTVLRVVHELTGTTAPELSAETPLMEAGFDSLASTELSLRLQALTGVTLSPTLVFEQPTARAVTAYLVGCL
jgi:acyl carrier protein